MKHSSFRITDASRVAEVRRAAGQHAADLGWSSSARGEGEIVATELATNLVKHARAGVLSMTSRMESHDGVLVFVAVDSGPGMIDQRRCFEDGYSTAGSPGTGLGAVRRLAQHTEVDSSSAGTVITAELRRPLGQSAEAMRPKTVTPRFSTDPLHSFELAAFAVAKEGESENGDAWAYRRVGNAIVVLACDGLGHGPEAARASALAVETFLGMRWRSPREGIGEIHAAIRSTRGAAAAIASVDPALGEVRFCGVGNIVAGIISDSKAKHLVSHNGILGSTAPRIGEFRYVWSHHSVLVMHSDGLTARWQARPSTRFTSRHVALVAGTFYRDLARHTDDSVVVALREGTHGALA